MRGVLRIPSWLSDFRVAGRFATPPWAARSNGPSTNQSGPTMRTNARCVYDDDGLEDHRIETEEEEEEEGVGWLPTMRRRFYFCSFRRHSS